PSRNGRNRRSRSIFFSPKRAMSTKVSAPANTASRHNKSTSSSGYITLPRWRGSGKSLKCLRKTTASKTAPHSPATLSIAVPRESIQRIGTDSAFQRFVTYSFTRLPCRKWPQERQDHAGDGIGNGIADDRDWIPGPLLHSVDRRCTGRLSGNRTT